MELKILEDKKGQVIFEIIGADHSLSNVLKEKIAEQKGVTSCSYNIEHPLVSNPKFIIEADNAQKALISAIDELKKENETLGKLLKKA